MKSVSFDRLARRQFLRRSGLVGLAALGVACAQPASSPTTAPAAQPTLAPTTAPAKPTAAASAQPTAVPAASSVPKAAATQAPAKLPSLTPFKVAEASPLFESAFRQMALEKGFWRDLGLDVEVQHIASGTTMIQGLVAGELDAASLGSSPVYPAIAGGAPIKMTASFMPRGFYLFYVGPSISSWADLEGRRIGGGAPGALLHELARAVLIEQGVDFDKVEYLNVGGSPDVFRAVATDKIDGGVSGIEFSREAEQTGQAKSLGDVNQILPRYLRYCDIASERTLTEKRDAYLAFLYGQTQGHRYALAHKQETLDLATKVTNRDSSELGWVFDWYVDNKVIDPNGLVDPAKVEYMIDLSVRFGTMQAAIPASRVIDDSIQQQVVEMLGRI